MSVKPPTIDHDQARLIRAYARVRGSRTGIRFADTIRRRAALLVQAGHVVAGGWGYRWDRAAGSIERYPTLATARVGVDAMPKRTCHSEVYPRGYRP